MHCFIGEFKRYKQLLEDAVAQVNDEEFLLAPGKGDNAIATLVKHLGGNLHSRFTDFLTTDGEKPWRNREGEFKAEEMTREEIMAIWQKGWATLESNTFALTDADLKRQVTIRGVAFTVEEALARSLGHFSYHVGQIVFLAKMFRGSEWRYLSIPPGQSDAYNQNPTMERGRPAQ